MIQLTNAIINNASGLSSGAYVVEDTITLSQDLTIPEDVTLTFQGGKFVVAEDCKEQITIIGSNTRLVAPICTIFGKDIEVKGTWDIDRAYPQWFEPVTKVVSIEINAKEPEKYDDWSTPINNAIKMKQVGEVFLKNGDYSIASPIHINKGIQFIGENSQPVDENCKGSTRIFPVAEGSNYFNHPYMIYVNSYITEEENQQTNEKELVEHVMDSYLDQSTIIKNICFTDFIKKSKDHEFTQKCILAGGGVHLDRIVWYDFLQAVKYTETYNDTRSITNCSFKTDENKKTTSEEYAFNMGFLGDAFKFEHNAVHSTFNRRALRISNCGGASIQGNIINSDILIDNCKAIVFNANHCENGIQIEIEDSCVSTQNNFIWKGENPTYFIHSSGSGDKSVVSLNNDLLIVRNFLLEDPTIFNVNNLLSTLKTDMEHLAEYDISLDKDSILNIENVFRYDIGFYGFGKMYPCGIRAQKYARTYTNDEKNPFTEHFEDFNEFNNYSYCASCKSQILSGYNLNVQKTIRDVNSPSVYVAMQNKGVYWLGEAGYYKYYYQLIWDEIRGIKNSSSSENTSNCIKQISWADNNQPELETDVKVEVENTSGLWIENVTLPQGVLLGISEDSTGNCVMVRLFRESTKESNGEIQIFYEYVDVPVCGTQYLYDNGVSVSGYQWKSEGASSLFLQNTSDKNLEMFRIIDGNVECFTKDNFTPGSGWKRGDVIHNISSNPSTLIISDDIN